MLLHIPDVLTAVEVASARDRLDATGWIDGVSAERDPSGADNRQIPGDHPAARELGQVVLAALARAPMFMAAALPLHICPPLFVRHEGDQPPGSHMDNAVVSLPGVGRLRADLSATLFLSDPEEYDGGELCVDSSYGTRRVKLPAGHLVLYPSTGLYSVAPLVRGARVSALFWVQSLVRDDLRRAMLFDLDVSVQELGRDAANHPATARLTGLYHNLLRRWAEP